MAEQEKPKNQNTKPHPDSEGGEQKLENLSTGKFNGLFNVWTVVGTIVLAFAALFFSLGHILFGFFATGIGVSFYLVALHFELKEKYDDRSQAISPILGLVCWIILIALALPSGNGTKPSQERTYRPQDSTQPTNMIQSPHIDSSIEQLSTETKHLRRLADKSSILDDPVYDARILVIFHRSMKWDSLFKFDAVFELRSLTGSLYVRTYTLNGYDTVQNPTFPRISKGDRLQYEWYLGVSQYTRELKMYWQYNILRNLQTDTLVFKVGLVDIPGLPFKAVRDFHGMTFTPYLPKEVLPLVNECWLIANGQPIIKCKLQKAHWAPANSDWKFYAERVTLLMSCDSDPTADKTPEKLWRINLHNPQ